MRGSIAAFLIAAGFASGAELQALKDTASELANWLEGLQVDQSAFLADAEVFHKGAVWAMRYDTPLAPNDVALVEKALARGLERAECLAVYRTPWTTKKGKV